MQEKRMVFTLFQIAWSDKVMIGFAGAAGAVGLTTTFGGGGGGGLLFKGNKVMILNFSFENKKKEILITVFFFFLHQWMLQEWIRLPRTPIWGNLNASLRFFFVFCFVPFCRMSPFEFVPAWQFHYGTISRLGDPLDGPT